MLVLSVRYGFSVCCVSLLVRMQMHAAAETLYPQAVIELALDGSESVTKGRDSVVCHVEGTATCTHNYTSRQRIEECIAILNVWLHTCAPISILFSSPSQIPQTIPRTAYRSLSASTHFFSFCFSSRIKALPQS